MKNLTYADGWDDAVQELADYQTNNAPDDHRLRAFIHELTRKSTFYKTLPLVRTNGEGELFIHGIAVGQITRNRDGNYYLDRYCLEDTDSPPLALDPNAGIPCLEVS